MPMTFVLVCIFLLLSSCTSEEGDSAAHIGELPIKPSVATVAETVPKAVLARIVRLDPESGGPTSDAVETSALRPAAVSAEPLDEIVKTVAQDGTISVNFGNRFARPILVHIDCAGQPYQTHSTDDLPSDSDCAAKQGDGE